MLMDLLNAALYSSTTYFVSRERVTRRREPSSDMSPVTMGWDEVRVPPNDLHDPREGID